MFVVFFSLVSESEIEMQVAFLISVEWILCMSLKPWIPFLFCQITIHSFIFFFSISNCRMHLYLTQQVPSHTHSLPFNLDYAMWLVSVLLLLLRHKNPKKKRKNIHISHNDLRNIAIPIHLWIWMNYYHIDKCIHFTILSSVTLYVFADMVLLLLLLFRGY